MSITMEQFAEMVRETSRSIFGASDPWLITWKQPGHSRRRQYLFVGEHSAERTDGAITTQHRFDNGIVSIAHIQADGRICQYREVIGHVDEITFVRKLRS